MSAPRCYRFGAFELDVPTRRLRRLTDGHEPALSPRAFDTLLFLLERPGQLVDKATLLEAVWPGIVVEENNLAQAVSTLRRALGDDREQHRYIETVPSRGYRFVAEVSTAELASATDTQPNRRVTNRRPGIYAAAALAGLAAVAVWLTLNQRDSNGALPPLHHERISAAAGNHRQPALSPDGTRVAFTNDQSGTSQLWVQSLDRGSALPLTDGDGDVRAPSWSAAGTEILFTRVRRGEAPQLWAIDAMGTLPARRVLDNARHGSFSTAGTGIVFERDGGIWTAGADGRDAQPVRGVPERQWPWRWTYPVFSPDGARIAFFQQETGPLGDIWIVDTAGGNAEPLTRVREQCGKPAWGPDGQHIYFASRIGGTWNLWRVAVADGRLEPVTSGVGADGDPVIAADGATLVYTNQRLETRFRLSDPQTGATESLPSTGSLSWHPRASHDGRRFAYFAEVAPREQVFIMDIESGTPRQVTFGGSDELNVMATWGSGDQHLYFYENLSSHALRRIASAGGPSEPVFEDFRWERNQWFEVSPDGTMQAWVRVTGNTSRVVVRSDDGTERLLDADIVSVPRWSADGREIVGPGRDGIVICQVDDGACRYIVSGASGPAAWSRTTDGIYYSRRLDGAPGMRALWYTDRNGDNPRPVMEFGPIRDGDGPFQVIAGDRILWNEHVVDESTLWRARLDTSDDGS